MAQVTFLYCIPKQVLSFPNLKKVLFSFDQKLIIENMNIQNF